MESIFFLLSGSKLDVSELLGIKPVYSNDYDRYIIFKTFYNELTETKNKIDSIEKNSKNNNLFNRNNVDDKFELVVNKNVAKIVDNWNSVKKLTNTYEMVHTHNKSVAYYIPVSRSYFKMTEILNEFELFKNIETRPVTIVSLAEAPGGFIEYIAKYRSAIEDQIFGLTLKGTNSSVPGWQRLHNSLNKMNSKSNVKLHYGNMYNIDELSEFMYKMERKATIVTADGGFDYTANFNYQEQDSYRLIYSEILTALAVQEVGGHFVCKIFDIFSVLTLKMIYIVYCLYDNVYIYKPKTSRLANSEKYLIAKGFRGASKLIEKLANIHTNWGTVGVIDLEGIILPSNFIQSIYIFNKNYVKNQIDNINLTLSMIISPPTKALYQKITNQQVHNALDWCEKYKEPINYKMKQTKII